MSLHTRERKRRGVRGRDGVRKEGRKDVLVRLSSTEMPH